MSRSYDLFLRALKKWPNNPNRKSDCDYAFWLRETAKNVTVGQNPFPGDEEENISKIDALNRLADNKYATKYNHKLKHGATGIPLHELEKILNKLLSESNN